MIDEKMLQELRDMVYKDAPQTAPPPTQWEILQACFDTLEAALRVVRAAEALARSFERMGHDHHQKLVAHQTLESATEHWGELLQEPLEFGPLLEALAPFRSEEKRR